MALAVTLQAEGLDVKAQVAPRPIGVLLGLQASANVFTPARAYLKIAGPPARRADRPPCAIPERRRRILDGHAHLTSGPDAFAGYAFFGRFDEMYVLDDPVDYNLDSSRSLGAMARRAGVDPAEYAYDVQLQRERPPAHLHPDVQLRPRQSRCRPRDDHLAGGHVRSVRRRCPLRADLRREHDHHLPVPVGPRPPGRRRDTRRVGGAPDQPATGRPLRMARPGGRRPRLSGRSERHRPGRLGCGPPEIATDLPAGGRRLLQAATGYRWTLKRGAVTFEDGVHTGELPGNWSVGVRVRSDRGTGVDGPDVLRAILDHAGSGPDRPAVKDSGCRT